MISGTTTTVSPRVTPFRAGARDRVFYSTMAIGMASIVFIGFGPTYYVRFMSAGPMTTVSGGPFTTTLHVHGALFTAWVLLFVIQTGLVASRRVAVHRRLGLAGAVLAAAMLVVGTSTAIDGAARGFGPRFGSSGIEPLAFLAIPLFDMVLFALFVGAAFVQRRNKEAHKRFMLLAYISIFVAALARLPGVVQIGPPAFFSIGLLFIVISALYDRISRGRVHPVYIWGGALFAISVPMRLAISGTAAWRTFAEFLTR